MEEKKIVVPKNDRKKFPKCEGFRFQPSFFEDEEKWPPTILPSVKATSLPRREKPTTRQQVGLTFAALPSWGAFLPRHVAPPAPSECSTTDTEHLQRVQLLDGMGGFWQHWDSLGQVKSGWIPAQKRSHFVEFTRIHQDIWCCLIVSENYCRNEEAFCVDGSPSVTYLFCYTIELQYMSWGFCCHSLNQSCGKKPYLASGIPMFVLDERKENRKLWKSRMTRVKNFGGKVSQKNRIPHETCFLLMLWWKPKCYYFQFRVLWFGLCHPTYLPFISLNMPQPAYIPRFSPLKHPSSSITYPLRLSITLFGMGFPDIMEWI